ncbi:MAG: adenylyltransferase/cytidyltransferase family protein [Chlamydiia bacterium]|nr:adenylyltransferase/cytidyltransferase family protein [Chlamydiia bacterium]
MFQKWRQESRTKCVEPKDIEALVAQIRSEGRSIATINGSFDLLHAGHLHILYEASLQADVLIVALNSDASIQQYKSAKRPIIPLEYRIEMLTALQFVDYVTWFEETDPRSLLERIRPDVHCNGAEYGENCLEAETVRTHGGRIHIIELVPGLSTSNIIQKISEICGD